MYTSKYIFTYSALECSYRAVRVLLVPRDPEADGIDAETLLSSGWRSIEVLQPRASFDIHNFVRIR